MTSITVGKRAKLYLNICFVGSSQAGKTKASEALFKSFISTKTERGTIIENVLKLTHEVDTSSEFCIRLFKSVSFEVGNNRDDESITEIETYLKNKHEEYNRLPFTMLTEKELNEQDNRIHCILYFLKPHTIEKIDKNFLRRVGTLVPLVPIISKVDAMTNLELYKQLDSLNCIINDIKEEIGENIIFDFENNEESFNDETSLNNDEVSEISYQQIPQEKQDFILPLEHQEDLYYPQVNNIFGLISRDDSVSNKKKSDFSRLHRLLFDSGKMIEMITKTKEISIKLAKESINDTACDLPIVSAAKVSESATEKVKMVVLNLMQLEGLPKGLIILLCFLIVFTFVVLLIHF